ncbi:MAG: hypothetical protein AAGC93_22225 [Cyanobacteria bacterium P01_F01_bin.53]
MASISSLLDKFAATSPDKADGVDPNSTPIKLSKNGKTQIPSTAAVSGKGKEITPMPE